ILNMSVASTEGCNARLSIPSLTTAGDEASPPPPHPPVIVLRHKDATSSPSTASAAPQQQLGNVRYYADNRVCDDIFTTVTEEDQSTAEQTVPVAGFHMRQGSCIFGLEVTSAANTDLSLPPNGALTIELQITVSVVSAVLHSALRRAFPMPVHGTDGVVISYRAVLTLEKE
ncbi:GPI-anchored surface protein, putative, partial [Bodo saltans]